MPQLVFNRTPVQTGNVIPVITLGVTDSSRHRHGMPLCQQPVESCSDVANPLGNRATAGSQCLMTQLSPGVVIAVEEVVLFFNSFVQPMDLLDGILPRLVVRRNYNTKIFWGWASRDCRFCVGADGPGGFSFAIRKVLPAVPNPACLVLAQCSSWRHSLPAHPHEQDRARTPSSFSPPADLSCAFLTQETRSPELSSSFPISFAHFYQELMASFFSLLMASFFSLLCSLSGLSCSGRGKGSCAAVWEAKVEAGAAVVLFYIWFDFLVGHRDKCELQLCQKSTWRVHICKMD